MVAGRPCTAIARVGLSPERPASLCSALQCSRRIRPDGDLMEWILIFQLLGGETAELPATKAQCVSTLELAAQHGGIAVNIKGRDRQIIPAWSVACIERAVRK